MSNHVQPGLHPDADSLSAFVEGVLPGHERQECLAHLNGCARCREIVFLAQEPIAVESPAPAPTWKRWFAPIPLFSAAAIVSIAILVAVMVQKRPAAPAPVLTAIVRPPAEIPPAPVLDLPVPPAPKIALPPLNVQAPAPVAEVPAVTAGASGIVQPTVAPLPVPAAAPFAPAVQTAPRAAARGGSAGLGGGILGGVIDGLPAAAPPPPLASVSGSVTEAGSQTHQITVESATSAVGAVAAPKDAPRALPLNGRSYSALVTLSPGAAVILPNQSTAVTSARRDKLIVAANSSGALFLSNNAGKSWKNVKAVWPGQVVNLTLTPDASAPSRQLFQLTTDSSAIWLSRDGSHWNPKK